MEVVVRSDAGDADMRLVADPDRHTLADLARCVLDDPPPRAHVAVDDARWAPDATFADVGVRRGSLIDVRRRRDPPSPAGWLLQIAGHGTGARVELRDGSFRLGPALGAGVEHLQVGSVAEPAIGLDVQGQLVEVVPLPGFAASLSGEPLTARRPWTHGELVVGDQVFVRATDPSDVRLSVGELRPPGRGERHLTPVPIGRALDRGADAVEVTLDPVGGIGIVGDRADTLAILRGIVLRLAGRSWPHGTALGLRTARPDDWEWTKWLTSVDSPRARPTPLRPERHVIVVDDGSAGHEPGDDRASERWSDGVIVIAAAEAQHHLVAGLSGLVHPAGGGGDLAPTSISVTSVANGLVTVEARVAPYAPSVSAATDLARRQARAIADEPQPVASSETLELVPWTISRRPTSLERRLSRRSLGDAGLAGRRTPRREPGSVRPRLDRHAVRAARAVVTAGVVDERRLVLPVGIWEARDEPATIPLQAGSCLVVVGPRRSGRSTLLALMAAGVRHASIDVGLFVVAPRRGALIDAAEQLGIDAALGSADVAAWCDRIADCARPLVFVDGADRVGGPSFVRLARDCASHAAVVASFDELPGPGHWSEPLLDGAFRLRLDHPRDSALFEARHRSRRVLLVNPDPTSTSSGDGG